MSLIRFFSSRRGLLAAVLLVAAAAVAGGGFIRISLKQLESNLPAIESGRLRDGFVALGDLHRLTLSLLAVRDAANDESPQIADVVEAIDYLYVRADTMKTAYRDAETERSRRLVAEIDEIIALGDAFVSSGGADWAQFRGAIMGALGRANRELIEFVNAQQYSEAQAIAVQARTLRLMTWTTVGILCLFTGVSVYAVILLRGEMRSEKKRRRAEEKARYLAYFDPLTGLANRARFTEIVTGMIARSDREDRPTLILFDLDEFKRVNDSYGHASGDALLAAFAERIDAIIRQEGGVSARLGGDEFAVAWSGRRSCEELAGLCDRLLAAIRAPLQVEGVELRPSASLGVALAQSDHGEAGQLLKCADLALYQAKEAGRNTYAFYDGRLAAAIRRRREIEASLAGAVDRGELLLVYQPQIRLDTGAIYGFEALIRWLRDGKLTPPNDFIPVAESTGAILDLDIWGLEVATLQIAQWIREGSPPVSVSVNLSPLHFRDDAIIGHVRRALEQSALPPHLLTLEVTESLLLEDWNRVMAIIRSLHGLGVRIALDDFGTGYSSLGYLRRLKADQLKIDRSFLSEIEASVEDQTILSAFVALARGLDIDLLVEGVETSTQLALLRRLGCARAQGYLFSPPIPTEAARRLAGRVFDLEALMAGEENAPASVA